MTDDAGLTLLQSRVAAWGRAVERIGAEIDACRAGAVDKHGWMTDEGGKPTHATVDTATLDVWATGLRGIVHEIESDRIAGRYLDTLRESWK